MKKNETTLEKKLQNLIFENLASGDRKPLPTEKQMLEKFGVSRTVLREALSRFEASGLIVALQGSGRYAQHPDVSNQITDGWTILIRTRPELILELLDIRMTMEIGFVPKVIERIETSDLQALRMLVQKMKENAASHNNFVDEDKEFHRILYASMSNILLDQLLKAFWDIYEQSNIINRHEDLHEIATLHERLVETIAKKDSEGAVRLLSEHFFDARYRIIMSL